MTANWIWRRIIVTTNRIWSVSVAANTTTFMTNANASNILDFLGLAVFLVDTPLKYRSIASCNNFRRSLGIFKSRIYNETVITVFAQIPLNITAVFVMSYSKFLVIRATTFLTYNFSELALCGWNICKSIEINFL